MLLWTIYQPNQFPIYSIPMTYWFPVWSISLVPFPDFLSLVSLSSQSSVALILDPVSVILFPDWLYLLDFPQFFFNLSALGNYFHNADSALVSSHSRFMLVVLHTSVRSEGEQLRPQDSCFLFYVPVPSTSLVHNITLSPCGIRIQHKVAWETGCKSWICVSQTRLKDEIWCFIDLFHGRTWTNFSYEEWFPGTKH